MIIGAPRWRVWAVVRDIPSHVTWMEDAVAIRFTSSSREGVGTTFDCDTRVGPMRLVDRMEVTEWREGRVMGIRHRGLVQGEGRFRLTSLGPRRTRFVWEERLAFPRWAGGPLAGVVARPVLRAIWRRNLRNLKELVEAPANSSG